MNNKSLFLPHGFDRADGQTAGLVTRPGTATPAGAITVRSYEGIGLISIEEDPESPEIERAEQCTIRKRYTMSWTDALDMIEWYKRGLILEDSAGRITRLLSAKIVHHKGDWATLETVEESVSFDTPPDEFNCCPVELGINIMKHPRYAFALFPTIGDDTAKNRAQEIRNHQTIKALQLYMDSPSYPERDYIPAWIKLSVGYDGGTLPSTSAVPLKYRGKDALTGSDMCKRACMEIIQKFWANEETPYVAGIQITWASYFWRPPYLDLGGRNEDPILDVTATNPGLPDYFWLTSSSTNFLSLLSTINPQCYSVDGITGGTLAMSWLRKADNLQYQRTWFRLERNWIGSPVGHWDRQLFAATRRPQVLDDYTDLDASGIPDYRT